MGVGYFTMVIWEHIGVPQEEQSWLMTQLAGEREENCQQVSVKTQAV